MARLRRIFQRANTFQGQQRLVIVSACTIVLVISLCSSLIYEAISFDRDNRARLGALADIIAADISAALVFGDSNAINKTIQTLEVDPAIIQLFVLNARGEVVSRYVKKDRPELLRNIEQSLKHIRGEDSGILFDLSPEVTRPIVHDNVQLGSILLELDRNLFLRKMLTSCGIGLAILTLSVIGSYQLARWLGEIVTDPLQSLAATMEEVTRTKNYSVRAEVGGASELALLSEGFNQMLGVIEERDEALLESEYRWKFAIEGSGDGVWDWNIRSGEARYSSRCNEMLGYADEEILPTYQEWLDRIHPEDLEHVAGAMLAYLEGKATHYVAEYRLRCKDGSYKWILGRGMVVSRNGDGKPLRMIGTHTDITERKEHENEHLKMEKLESLGVLAGGIAHDFNNILTGIIGNITFAQMHLDDTHKAHKPLVAAEKASVRATELAYQLLTFARGGKPVKKVISVPQLVSESVSLTLHGSNVMAVTEIPPSIHSIEADEGQLSQVFNNIIINATQAMPGGGTVTITARNECLENGNILGLTGGNYVTLSFADQGCGIPEDGLKRIFDPYFTTKSAGKGLGLASAYSIVSRHGGHIGVSSVIGKGTTFTIYLPSTGKSYQTAQTASAGRIVADHPGGSILVMDDEEMIRLMTTEILGYMGYEVTTCANGAEAIDLYKAARESGAPFSAVIMDLTIPGGMGGKEAARQILSTDPNACLIVSSGYSNDPIMSDYRSFGFNGAMTKPYKSGEVGEMLSSLLSGRRF